MFVVKKETFKIKKKQLKIFVKEVFNFVFNDNLDATFNFPLKTNNNNNNNIILPFIKDPNAYVGDKIQIEMQNTSKKFLLSNEIFV